MTSFYGRKGSRNLNSKVTAQSAAVIRHLWRAERWTLTRLSTEFGLSPSAVQKITSGKTWANLDVALELAKLKHLNFLVGGDGDERGAPATSERSHSPYVVESGNTPLYREGKNSTTHDGKVEKIHSIESGNYTLESVLADLGLERVEDLTEELLGTLKGQTQKQLMLVAAYEKATSR